MVQARLRRCTSHSHLNLCYSCHTAHIFVSSSYRCIYRLDASCQLRNKMFQFLRAYSKNETGQNNMCVHRRIRSACESGQADQSSLSA